MNTDTSLAENRVKSVHHSYSGFWRRFAAFLIDSFCLFVIKSILGFVVLFAYGASFYSVKSLYTNGLGFEGQDAIFAVSSFSLAFFVTWAIHFTYFMLQYLSSHQATFGMRAFNIKLVDENDHGPVTFAQCFWRYIASFFSGLFLGIGYLMIVFTSRKQAFHDLLTNVCVVKTEKVIDNLDIKDSVVS